MKSGWLSGTSTLGAVVGKVTCPACVPALASLFSSLGIGFTVGRQVLLWVTLAFLTIGLVGLYANSRKHGQKIFLLIGLVASIAIFVSRYSPNPNFILYPGAAILLGNALFDYRRTKNHASCCSISKKRGSKRSRPKPNVL